MSDQVNTTKSSRPSALVRGIVFSLKVVLPLTVVACAAFIVFRLMATAPEATRAPRNRMARLVEVELAKPFEGPINVEASGVVTPAAEVTLTAQVSGEVVEISDKLVPGGRFETGEVMLRIDPRDYEYAVKQRESDVTRARADLALEEGNQDVVLREYEVLGRELSEDDKALVLRKPQLETAKGALAAAEATLSDARLDLERTTLTAPFDALVISESVDLGTRLTTQSPVGQLVGLDTYWVELSVPQKDIRWVRLPTETTPGSKVVLRHPQVWGRDRFREGHVIQLLPDLSEQGRMARILVAVDDPLGREPGQEGLPTLLLGQYLEAEIVGERVENVIAIDRSRLRDGDNVWVMNSDDQLEVRPLDVLYRGKNTVIVTSGISVGERIVTTDLATANAGMPLRTEDDSPDAAAKTPPRRNDGPTL